MTKNTWQIGFRNDITLAQNAEILSTFMRSEGTARGTTGYFFDFDGGEWERKRRFCPRVEQLAWHMMEQARNQRKPAEVFLNLLGDIAVRIQK